MGWESLAANDSRGAPLDTQNPQPWKVAHFRLV